MTSVKAEVVVTHGAGTAFETKVAKTIEGATVADFVSAIIGAFALVDPAQWPPQDVPIAKKFGEPAKRAKKAEPAPDPKQIDIEKEAGAPAPVKDTGRNAGTLPAGEGVATPPSASPVKNAMARAAFLKLGSPAEMVQAAGTMVGTTRAVAVVRELYPAFGVEKASQIGADKKDAFGAALADALGLV